jgi:hypothetical protein
MPPRRKRRPARDLETNTPPEEMRQGPPRQTPDSPSRAEDADLSEYERELDRLDAATSTRH